MLLVRKNVKEGWVKCQKGFASKNRKMNIKEKLLVVAGKNLENMICVRNAKAGFLFTKVLPDLLSYF